MKLNYTYKAKTDFDINLDKIKRKLREEIAVFENFLAFLVTILDLLIYLIFVSPFISVLSSDLGSTYSSSLGNHLHCSFQSRRRSRQLFRGRRIPSNRHQKTSKWKGVTASSAACRTQKGFGAQVLNLFPFSISFR